MCLIALVVKKNLPANARDLRDTGLIPGSGSSPGGGNGTPLQKSCLENPMDRGTWWATVHRVTVRHNWSDLAHSTYYANAYFKGFRASGETLWLSLSLHFCNSETAEAESFPSMFLLFSALTLTVGIISLSIPASFKGLGLAAGPKV